MVDPNKIVIWLYHDTANFCVRFSVVNAELKSLAENDTRRANLESERESLRARIVKRHGVLGKHFPTIGEGLGSEIFTDPIDSTEYRRKYLTIEDVLQAILDAYGAAVTADDFDSFAKYLEIYTVDTNAEALDAVVSANPSRYELRREGERSFYRLKPCS